MAGTYYDILDLPLDADDGQIEAAYRQAKAAASKDPQRLGVIEDAYQTLANPMRRKAYLKSITSASPPPAASRPAAASPPAQPTPAASASASRRKKTDFMDLPETPPARQEPAPRPLEQERAAVKKPGTELMDDSEFPPVPAPQPVKISQPPQPRTVTDLDPLPPQPAPAPPPAPGPASTTAVQPTPRERTVVEDPPTPAGPLVPRTAPFVSLSYSGAAEDFPLHPGDNLVGRPPKNGPPPDVPLPDPVHQYVSRRHAILRNANDAWFVIDPGSKNGTRLNHVKLQAEKIYPLKHGDILEIEGRILKINIP